MAPVRRPMVHAVKVGRQTGIFRSVAERKRQVDGYHGALYKTFTTEKQARDWLEQTEKKVPSHSPMKRKVGRPKKASQSSLSDYEEDSSNWAECTICLDEFTEAPLVLVTCGHSFCRRCLQGLYSNDLTRVTCPVCNTVCESPLNALPQNYQLFHAVEAKKRTDSNIAKLKVKAKKRAASTKTARKSTSKKSDYSLEEPTVIYTDGSCSNNGKRTSTAGYGIYWPNGPESLRKQSKPLPSGPATSNRAEMEAIKQAMIQAKEHGYHRVLIRSDSKYVMTALSKWLPNWERTGWKTAKGTDVLNKEDFQQIQMACQGLDVKFEHVEAHQGIEGNEQADKLAKQASGAGKAKKK